MLSHRALAETRAAADCSLVHDVVVIERGQVGQLDDHRGWNDLRSVRVAEVRCQRADQRTEPLATGVDQVPGRTGDDLVVGAHRFGERRLDALQASPHGLLQLGVGERDAERSS